MCKQVAIHIYDGALYLNRQKAAESGGLCTTIVDEPAVPDVLTAAKVALYVLGKANAIVFEPVTL